nr:hypothetical protein CFP56_01417 [Quercus suber]
MLRDHSDADFGFRNPLAPISDSWLGQHLHAILISIPQCGRHEHRYVLSDHTLMTVNRVYGSHSLPGMLSMGDLDLLVASREAMQDRVAHLCSLVASKLDLVAWRFFKITRQIGSLGSSKATIINT